MASAPRLLIIEDEPSLVNLLAARFEKEGFAICKCTSAAAALKMAVDNHPDMILLDLLLPNGDGEALLKELRTRKETKEIPVVILTNLADEEVKKRCLDFGCADYLVKADFGLDQIVEKVKELYGRCVSERH